MPRPGLPPTPASSTDISGKNHSHLSSLETSFTLPPPAITGTDLPRSSSASTAKSSSESSFHPVTPTSPLSADIEPRLRPSVTQKPSSTADDFSLPPPPTRSRKITQWKPKRQRQDQVALEDTPDTARTLPKGKAAKNTVPSSPGMTNKKKQPSSTSVAGRKIARKTAHSLIERRRRSKMNEEFGVLKDMIPACKDQEMHKLAILQVCYPPMFHLRRGKLKSSNDRQALTTSATSNNVYPTSELPPITPSIRSPPPTHQPQRQHPAIPHPHQRPRLGHSPKMKMTMITTRRCQTPPIHLPCGPSSPNNTELRTNICSTRSPPPRQQRQTPPLPPLPHTRIRPTRIPTTTPSTQHCPRLLSCLRPIIGPTSRTPHRNRHRRLRTSARNSILKAAKR